MSLTIHIVPHTHWDREWYLPFQVFRIRLVHLMDHLLDILGQDGAYRHFMLDGQSILLEDYLEIRPERAAEITRFVRTGQLSIGPWYVLPDEFLVAPESLVRNLILGDRVCSRFGGKMFVGYVPDPFGHVSQLPQLLRGFDIETAAFRRGLADEAAELWWDSPDGGRVLVCYLRDGYDNAARLPTADPEAFVAAVRSLRESLAPYVDSGNVLLMAGTDHQEPQPDIPKLIAYANSGHLGKDRLVHSSLQEYFEAVRDALEADEAQDLEVVTGELRSPQRHHLLPGVASTRMWIKQRNDAVETLLTRWAEPFSAWAELMDLLDPETGAEYRAHLTGHEPLRRVRHPAALIWRAWRLLVENHPHDSICGCSVDQVHKEMAPRFDQAEQIGEEVTAQSLVAVAEKIDTRSPALAGSETGNPQPLVVFNPVGGPRTDLVTVPMHLPGAPDAVEVVNSSGQTVPFQLVVPTTDHERSLFQLEVSPEELTTYSGLIEAGRVLNHVIHRIEVKQANGVAQLRVLLSEAGEPNRAHLASARAEVEDLIAAGAVSRIVIRGERAEKRDLLFVAPDIPGYGYEVFTVRAHGKDIDAERVLPKSGAASPDVDETNMLETDLFRIQVDTRDGTLALTDKTSGVIYTGLNRFTDGGDRGDEYNYCPPEEDRLIGQPAAPPIIKVVDDGPARKTLHVFQVYRVPRSLRTNRRGRQDDANEGESALVDLPIISRVTLYPGVHRVDIETTVSNQAQDHRLRVHFPVPARVDHAYTEAHYCVTRRPVPQIPPDLDTRDWVEQPVATVPQRGWSEVRIGKAGLLVANRGLPEIEIIPDGEQTILALTLLRCVGWLSRDDLHSRQGNAGPSLPTPEAQCLGRHTFHYALIPYSDGMAEQARAQAEAFRTPLRAVVAGLHPGSLPPFASIVNIEPSTFVLTAIKQPEETSTPGLLVRGVNMSAQPIIVRLCPWRAFGQVARINLNEDFVEPLLPEPDGSVIVRARPWEIVTVRWRGE
jgi:alpha-mannosidase